MAKPLCPKGEGRPHYIWSIRWFGSVDSFKGTCVCGEEAEFTYALHNPPEGWDEEQYKIVRYAGMLFVESFI